MMFFGGFGGPPARGADSDDDGEADGSFDLDRSFESEEAGVDEGLLPLSLNILVYMENLYM